MRHKLKKLNWGGFLFVMILSMIGALLNENMNSIEQWLFLILVFGLPSALFFLIVGREK